MTRQLIKQFSVTQVLGVFTEWHNIPANVLKQAIDRGNVVHAASQAYLSNIFFKIPTGYQVYFDSIKRWVDRYVEYIYFIEKRFEDPILGFNGKPDIGCKLIRRMFQSERNPFGYRYPIIDIKTGQVEGKTWCGQGAAYKHLCNLKKKKYDCSIFLQAHPQGDWPKVLIYEYDEKDFAAFISALNAYRYFKG